MNGRWAVGQLQLQQPVGIVGAGALGQIFSAALTRAGHPVVLVTRPAGAERILTSGRIVLRGRINLEVPVARRPSPGAVHVSDHAGDLARGVRGILFTTKAHQLQDAADTARAAVAHSSPGWVAGVQNGILKDEVLSAAFGRSAVLGAVTVVGGQRDTADAVTVTATGPTYLGEIDRTPSARAGELAAALHQAALGGQVVPDIRSAQWSKTCNTAGMFAISSLTRLPNPELRASAELMMAYLEVVREAAAIAAALGVELGDYPNYPLRRCLALDDEKALALLVQPHPEPAASVGAGAMSSMAQDVVAGRPLEVEEIFGDLVRRAEEVGVLVPRLRLVTHLLRGLDGAASGEPARGRQSWSRR